MRLPTAVAEALGGSGTEPGSLGRAGDAEWLDISVATAPRTRETSLELGTTGSRETSNDRPRGASVGRDALFSAHCEVPELWRSGQHPDTRDDQRKNDSVHS